MELGKAQSTTWGQRALTVADHVWFALQVQALWALGALAGGLVLGWTPATAAAASVARDHERGVGGSMTTRFARVWREQFVRSNMAGAPYALLAAMAGSNVLLVPPSNTTLAAASWAGAVLVAGALSWFGPVAAHYEVSPVRHALSAIRLVAQRPFPTLVMLLAAAALAWLSTWSPAVLVFFAIGAWLTICTHVALGTFAENEERLVDGPPQASLASILPSRPLDTH